MSFVFWRLISRSQNWLKQYLVVLNNLKPKDSSYSGFLSHFSSVAYIWGAGDGGQLGTGTKECSLLPIQFPVPSEVSHIGCGYGFTIAAEADSPILWTTGLNSSSQLARQLSSSSGQGPSLLDLSASASLSSRIQQISCGRSHSAVLMDNGEVLTCGGHFNGQCGVGDVDGSSIKQFTKIQSLPGKIKQLACGLDHTLLLCDDGRVMSCGWGADGQTGLGHFKDEATFNLIEGELKDVQIKQVASSADCCLALSDEGEVFSWGNNEYGQLAVQSSEEQFAVPKRASLLKGLPEITQVAAGGSFCVALTVTGELYSWGYGVLGHGREVSFSRTPRKIQEFSSTEGTVTRVFCGPDNTAIVTDTGVLYTWGRGSFGRLGLGSEQDQWVPKKVELPGEVIDVSCGVDHMAAILKCS